MSKLIQNLEVGLDEDLEEKLNWMMPNHGDYRILRQSVDARRRHFVHLVYSLEVAEPGETLPSPQYEVPTSTYRGSEKPIIIGTGPAGLFAALRLVERGIPCLLFERGSSAEKRIISINRFWRYGILDPRNNVCYGEGGAGLYSDGKLITRIKSPHIPYVLHRLVKFGAPQEIQYLSNPHVGSDKIRRLIPKLRKYLLSKGCEIHFDSQITKLLLEDRQIVGVQTEHGKKFHSQHVILATGHSASDMLEHLYECGIHLEGKSFAVGIRIEHPQSLINKIQYRDFSGHPKLKSANYRLTHHDEQTGVGVYSFCMCPGGYVLSCGTEADGIVCNGMSNFNRNSFYANSAIVVSIHHDQLIKNNLLADNDKTFAGLHLRRNLEKMFFESVQSAGGSKELPAQKLTDFLSGCLSPVERGSSPSGARAVRIDKILPNFIVDNLKIGLQSFENKMKGFLSDKSQIYAIESRTSCPIRVTRDESSLQSISHAGLYPCGEGAGYAGGITSAACDGVRCAEKIVEALIPSRSELQY